MEEIIDQPIFLNPHNKLDFSSDDPSFYASHPEIFQINLPSPINLTIRDLFRFLQSSLITSTTFDEKLEIRNLYTYYERNSQ